jgi:hypothetical protein
VTQQTFNAADNPALANDLVRQATSEVKPQTTPANLIDPIDTLINLPGGYVSSTGEVIRVAEVRELTGRDEEILSKVNTVGRMFITILSRAVIKIGNVSVTEEVLDELLAGDRDALLIGIFRTTFGNDAQVNSYCAGCKDYKLVAVDMDKDIVTKVLPDPINGRTFTVKGKKNEFLVTLPTGKTQRELSSDSERTLAELNSVLLESCVLQIDGDPVLTKGQIKNLGLVDRKTIIEEIYKRNPGPQFEDLSVDCNDCGGKVVVPINLGTLFQL